MNIKHQKGLSLIGMVIVSAVGLVFLFIGAKVGPMYYESHQIAKTMEKAKEVVDLRGKKGAVAAREFWVKFLYLLSIEGIDNQYMQHEKYMTYSKGKITFEYDRAEVVAGNLSVVAHFKHVVDYNE